VKRADPKGLNRAEGRESKISRGVHFKGEGEAGARKIVFISKGASSLKNASEADAILEEIPRETGKSGEVLQS